MLLTGPSHAERFRCYQANGYLKNINAKYIGKGGLPIFNSIYVNSCLDADGRASAVYPKVCLLPDPRFGNDIISHLEPSGLKKGAPEGASVLRVWDDSGVVDSFRNINKELISNSNDKILYGIYMHWLEENDPKYDLLIPWCLFGREARNKHFGKYGGGAYLYKHPIWNLSDYREFSNAVDFSEISSDPCSFSLSIDDNNHPSFKGFCFILALAKGYDLHQAFKYAMCFDTIVNDSLQFDGRTPLVCLCGDARYVSQISRMVRDGSIYLGRKVCFINESQVENALTSGSYVLDFVEVRADNQFEVNCRLKLLSKYELYKPVFYAAFYSEYIIKRDGVCVSKKSLMSYQELEEKYPFCIKLSSIPDAHLDSCFELNRKKIFTQKFAILLSMLISSEELTASDLAVWNKILDALSFRFDRC